MKHEERKVVVEVEVEYKYVALKQNKTKHK